MTKKFLKRLIKARSSAALADQIVASAGNFATMLLLARGLPPAEFGTFVLINSVCQTLYGFHTNLIISPLVVLGATATGSKTQTYSAAALTFTLALLPVSALFVLSASASLHRVITGLLAVIFVLAWQLQETTRRSLIAAFRYRDAIWGDAISYLGQACIVAVFTIRHEITLNVAFVTMAGTSGAATLLQGWQCRLRPPTRDRLFECAAEFWLLGKWMLVASLTSVAAGPLFPWLLNWFHGREAAGEFQAVMNVLGLVNPLIVSIPAIVMPVAANYVLSAPGRSDGNSLFGLTMKYVVQFELLLAPWLLILLLWPRNSLAWFYGKSNIYGGQTSALRWGIIVYILTVPMMVFGSALTGSGKTKGSAIMQGAGAAVSLICAPPLIFSGGVVGAILSEMITRGVRVVAAVRLLTATPVAGPREGPELASEPLGAPFSGDNP